MLRLNCDPFMVSNLLKIKFVYYLPRQNDTLTVPNQVEVKKDSATGMVYIYVEINFKIGLNNCFINFLRIRIADNIATVYCFSNDILLDESVIKFVGTPEKKIINSENFTRNAYCAYRYTETFK